jgi:hypothetical protein
LGSGSTTLFITYFYLCFQEHFDVVLVEDQTMEFPLALLVEIDAVTAVKGEQQAA